MPDTSIRTYRAKRDFAITAEPPPHDVTPAPHSTFVVQKHAAHRAGLHWDFRLEHDGVLWSWAVPKGPSLDPADRRVAIHVEDHPLDYAQFQGTIPAGQYGGGTVETWDRGTWTPLDPDPAAAMQKGTIHFTLAGTRLNGRFTLARLHRRDPRKQEGWFLIKGHDEHAREGIGTLELEREIPTLDPPKPKRPAKPAPAAVKAALTEAQAPQLATLVTEAPEGDVWLSEIKFDGYRILARIDHGAVRLLTRSGLDWAPRMPALAAAFARLDVRTAMLDGELVALDARGASSFPGLQAALKAGRDDTLHFYAFDLLHLNGWDLRPAPLLDRKAALHPLSDWQGALRYSEHVAGAAAQMHANACRMHLEGVICKRAGEPYRAGRGPGWIKLKCLGREEFVVLGWTPPSGSRVGLGALHVGYYDHDGQLHYAGGVGTGFDTRGLLAMRQRLDGMEAPPPDVLVAGDPVDKSITWVRPELVIEAKYADWSGAGRIRHPVFLGLREDKPARDVVRDIADPHEARTSLARARRGSANRGWHGAVPPLPKPTLTPSEAAPMPTAAPKPTTKPKTTIITARAPQKPKAHIGTVDLTHPDKELWPGISKQALADYWTAIAPHALPGLVHRPLSIVRCPDGVGGQQFFQKNGHGHLPHQIREGHAAGGQPFLAIDDLDGLYALVQMSAIELHPWGSPEADPSRPDHLVFDLDPGEGTAFADVVAAAHDVRARLAKLHLESVCRTTGGKGLHVVVPLRPDATWDAAKPFARAFAETMAVDEPTKYLAHLKIADRQGRILVDWLRNGLGATAVSSYCPRARVGAGVATPLAWSEVTPKLDPTAFTVLTVPKRLAKLKADPWAGYAAIEQRLPDLTAPPQAARAAAHVPGTRIVTARKPKPKA